MKRLALGLAAVPYDRRHGLCCRAGEDGRHGQRASPANAKGMTLYIFDKDKANALNCTTRKRKLGPGHWRCCNFDARMSFANTGGRAPVMFL